jgi:hypothetical protein
MSLRQLRARLERLEAQISTPANSLRTDEEIRARVAELGWKWWGWSHHATDPITDAEKKDIEYLKLHYPQYAPKHPLADQIQAWRDLANKASSEEEERSRLRQLERQKKAAAAARMSAEADSSYCPDGTGAKKTSRIPPLVGRKREAAAPVQVSYEDESDWRPIDDDDF